MKISRIWAMPNRNTFTIAPIDGLIRQYMNSGVWIDPFCGKSRFKDRCVTNDLNPDIEADSHLEGLDFLKGFKDESVDGVLFDPPYSLRQQKECYVGFGRDLEKWEVNNGWFTSHKSEIARILKPEGIVIVFGWQSNGVGKTLGMEMIELLLVPHGGAHNDTIVTVERKLPKMQGVLL